MKKIEIQQRPAGKPWGKNRNKLGMIRLTNNLGKARHSVRAAAWPSMRSAGRGLPALPALPHLFVFWMIPI
jgi:hypothetical protein